VKQIPSLEVELVKMLPTFYGATGFITTFTTAATAPSPELIESTLHLLFFKMHFNKCVD
jgi:hypothetical protein